MCVYVFIMYNLQVLIALAEDRYIHSPSLTMTFMGSV